LLVAAWSLFAACGGDDAPPAVAPPVGDGQASVTATYGLAVEQIWVDALTEEAAEAAALFALTQDPSQTAAAQTSATSAMLDAQALIRRTAATDLAMITPTADLAALHAALALRLAEVATAYEGYATVAAEVLAGLDSFLAFSDAHTEGSALQAAALARGAALLASVDAACAIGDRLASDGVVIDLGLDCGDPGLTDTGALLPPPDPSAEPARPDLDADPPGLVPISITASEAGFTTAQEAISQIQEVAGLNAGCGEAFEAAIAAEGTEPHGLTPADPLPRDAIDVIRIELQGDPADYELRVLTEAGIIFVSRDGLSTNPAIFAAAVQVEQFRRVGSGATFWASPEGAFWTRCS